MSSCDLTPNVQGDELEDAAGFIYRFEEEGFTANFSTKCMGTKDRFLVVISNLPTGDLQYLDADYTFTLTNTGTVAGADVPQVYLADAPDGRRMRLLGFERVELKPGESKTVAVKADPRLLARFDGRSGLGQWRITGGTYRIALGKSAGDLVSTANAELTARTFGK